MIINQNFKLLLILLFLPIVGMASEINKSADNFQCYGDKTYNDTYSVESRILSSKEAFGKFGEDCTTRQVEHVIYRTDEKGQKWYFARGIVSVSYCYESDDKISETGLPIDRDCTAVFFKGRLVINNPISEEFYSCFVDFATQNEPNHQLLLEAEQNLLKG